MLDEPAFTTRMVSVFAIGCFRLLVALAFKEGVPGGHTIFPGWCADQTMGPGCGARAGPWAGETLGCAHEDRRQALRSEEHTSELQSLMRISYAVFCLKKKK